ncbi:hypothetical protein, partial [Escherichia coli]|uniref:hypothetical protein n=1 Tax=Escherichia coli TaxID=562 RepID=UPI001BDC38E8
APVAELNCPVTGGEGVLFNAINQEHSGSLSVACQCLRMNYAGQAEQAEDKRRPAFSAGLSQNLAASATGLDLFKDQ